MKAALIASWYQKPTFLTYLLLPFSIVFGVIAKLRCWSYQVGLRKVTHFPVPIIVVGNLTVGGSGKTPFINLLAHYFKERGFKPGIVMRGYKGKSTHWPQVVSVNSRAELVGDEALMLAKQTECPVVVSPNRVSAVSQLIKDFQCELVLSDDGLQHYALGRKIEIVVIDGRYRLGNTYCLPAGPLRESVARLNTVDFVVVNGGASQSNEYLMQLVPDKIYKLTDPTQTWPLPVQSKIRVHAVAGIGFPERFFASLSELGFEVIPHSFPDHHAFSFADIDLPNYPIIMTAKDAVKCQIFADERHWCLAVKVEVSKGLLTKIQDRIDAGF